MEIDDSVVDIGKLATGAITEDDSKHEKELYTVEELRVVIFSRKFIL